MSGEFEAARYQVSSTALIDKVADELTEQKFQRDDVLLEQLTQPVNEESADDCRR